MTKHKTVIIIITLALEIFFDFLPLSSLPPPPPFQEYFQAPYLLPQFNFLTAQAPSERAGKKNCIPGR